ncbi:hypothetical protein CKAN_00480300 [Cinnamomum micranthum f. kanehirae]|uniref:Uncharacterized protein n=1 Tax=Cinnamomum micranthum f. kanehirae TaxID=337451 RepID=A0A443NCZ9_9MAGN|nr:hypothetical protein CKAN_00480300 [Cinnamomum micranthum f. kanehirae]
MVVSPIISLKVLCMLEDHRKQDVFGVDHCRDFGGVYVPLDKGSGAAISRGAISEATAASHTEEYAFRFASSPTTTTTESLASPSILSLSLSPILVFLFSKREQTCLPFPKPDLLLLHLPVLRSNGNLLVHL